MKGIPLFLMKKKLLCGLLYVAVGYLALVLIYFLYLEFAGSRLASAESFLREKPMMLEMPAVSSASAVKNYASVQWEAMPNAPKVDQKYEKIASLVASSQQFDPDEQRTRATVKEHNALIQEEAINSDNGRRFLRLTIGVPPDHFDAIVAALKKIGVTDNFQVTKTDKTNDYLELRAKRTTLEKTRDGFIELKKQGGKIDELIKLEQETLSLEGKIQEFGVQLGQFDKVNEFCTVRFTFTENKPAGNGVNHVGNFLESMQWASTIYLAWLGIAFAGLLCVVLLLVLMEKSKLFRSEP